MLLLAQYNFQQELWFLFSISGPNSLSPCSTGMISVSGVYCPHVQQEWFQYLEYTVPMFNMNDFSISVSGVYCPHVQQEWFQYLEHTKTVHRKGKPAVNGWIIVRNLNNSTPHPLYNTVARLQDRNDVH